MTVHIYDPEMCCTTGVCGPSTDPEMLRVAQLVAGLTREGYQVVRHMLSQDAAAFAADPEVYRQLLAHGPNSLPIVTVDNAVCTIGRYPELEDIRAMQGA